VRFDGGAKDLNYADNEVSDIDFRNWKQVEQDIMKQVCVHAYVCMFFYMCLMLELVEVQVCCRHLDFGAGRARHHETGLCICVRTHM
jgi:hypothetical protein